MAKITGIHMKREIADGIQSTRESQRGGNKEARTHTTYMLIRCFLFFNLSLNNQFFPKKNSFKHNVQSSPFW